MPARAPIIAAVLVAFALPAHGCRRPVVTVDAAPDQPAETAESAALVEVKYDALVVKGSEAYKRGDYPAAIKAFTQAIETKPAGFDAYINRGAVYQDAGAWQLALDDYRKAKDANPKSYGARNNIAWLLATCPDDNIRDGKAAIRHAEAACELTGW